MNRILRIALLAVLPVVASGQETRELKVPENRSRPDSRQITLKYLFFRSTSERPGPPIVYLAGGPGGSGIGASRGSRAVLFESLREHGDVIAFDQRGTGQSEGRTGCSETVMVLSPGPLDRRTVGEAYADATRRCAERTKLDAAAYDTLDSVADLDDLRRALGAEKLVLWGISYGTHLAIAAMREMPDRIDRVILAGIEGPDETYKLPSDQQALLEEIARLALASGSHPDLLGAVGGLLRDLEAGPKRVKLTHPLNGMSIEFALGPLDLQVALAQMLTGPETFAAMPDFVSRLERGDWTSLGLAIGRYRFGPAPSGMSVAMDCASGISGRRRAVIADEARRTLLGDAINLPFPEVCSGLQVPDLGDAYRAPLRTAIPALLISGTLDGRTRPRQAEELRMGMPNAQHLVIEGAGHSDPLFLSSPKILEAMKAFLRGRPLPERRIALEPMRFLPARTVADVPDETLERYVGTYRIDAKSVRKVVRAGSLLYTIRDSNPPFPLRPLSDREFFYEGTGDTVRFEVDAAGKGTAMVYRTVAGEAHRAVRE